MDLLEITLAVLVPLAAAGGFLLGSRRPSAVLESEPDFEVGEVSMFPQGGHKHKFTTMVADGRGWVCGVAVEGGICGWSRNFGEGGPDAD